MLFFNIQFFRQSNRPHSNGYRQDIPFMSYDVRGMRQRYSGGYPIGRKCQYPWDTHTISSVILRVSYLYPISIKWEILDFSVTFLHESAHLANYEIILQISNFENSDFSVLHESAHLVTFWTIL